MGRWWARHAGELTSELHADISITAAAALLCSAPIYRAKEGGAAKDGPKLLVDGVLQHAAVKGKAQQQPA